MTTVKLDSSQTYWVVVMFTLLIGSIFWATFFVTQAIEENTCIAAQGKYLDETDFDDCGYKE